MRVFKNFIILVTATLLSFQVTSQSEISGQESPVQEKQALEIPLAKEAWKTPVDFVVYLAFQNKHLYPKCQGLTQIALSCFAANDSERGQAVLNKAIHVAQQIDGEERRNDIIGDFAIDLAKLGEFEKALLLVKKCDDEKRNATTLSGIALALAESGEICQAIEVAEKIHTQDERDTAFSEVVSALADSGKIKAGLNVAELIVNTDLKSTATSRIVSVMVKKGNSTRLWT